MAYILTTKGESLACAPKNGTDFSLEELKQAIGGGYIEVVYLPDNRVMVIDEEGKLKQMPLNHAASMLYLRDTIVGDALVCDRSQIR